MKPMLKYQTHLTILLCVDTLVKKLLKPVMEINSGGTIVSTSIDISLCWGCIPPAAGYIPWLQGNIAIFPLLLFLL
jgi:hypothetical protein